MSAIPTVVRAPDSAAERLAEAGRSPQVLVLEGLLGALLGVLVLTWPGATTAVLAWIFGIQLIVTGFLQFVAAASGAGGTSGRVMSALLGTLSLLAGLLCLRTPLQTALVLGLLIGISWVVGGVIRVVQGLVAGRGGARGWRIAGGVLWLLAGAVVLAYPDASLVALVSIVGIVLLLEGAALVAVGLSSRRSHTTVTAVPADSSPKALTTVPPVPPRARP
jgi:uncharacterized membrane protein HdeD (DUF308 family)